MSENILVKGTIEITDPAFRKWFDEAAENNMKAMEKLLQEKEIKNEK